MIPPILHRIWLGSSPMPDYAVEFGQKLRELHPRWTIYTWTDETVDVDSLVCRAEFIAEPTPAGRSDILRLEVLKRYGGIYVDTDMEPLRRLDHLTVYHGFIGMEDERHFCNAVIAAEPEHHFINQLLEALPEAVTTDWQRPINERMGPGFITKMFWPGALPVVPRPWFYPYHFTEKDSPAALGPFPESFMVHRWMSEGREPDVAWLSRDA